MLHIKIGIGMFKFILFSFFHLHILYFLNLRNMNQRDDPIQQTEV
jgi:hypothetical protein